MTGQYPRLRSHTRHRKNGKVVTYYYYDNRGNDKPDEPLGEDYDKAKARWREIHERAPRIAGTVLQGIEAWEKHVLPTYESPVTKRNYRQNLKQLKAVFGPATWDGVTLVNLKDFLDNRKGKTQANRELSCFQVIWNYSRLKGLTTLPWPAAGMERSAWKNKERAREFEVTDDLFAAVYAEGDQVLRDCMDLSSATSMRLTDCRTIVLPRDEVLHLKASKTGKKVDFDVKLSEVLPALMERRRAVRADHLMLLSTPTGRKVSATMLRDRYELAREAAAVKAEVAGDDEFAARIRAMWLRDMRKYGSNQGTEEEAMQRGQWSDVATMRKHYRTKVPKAPPAR